jgi:hypothetical protein
LVVGGRDPVAVGIVDPGVEWLPKGDRKAEWITGVSWPVIRVNGVNVGANNYSPLQTGQTVEIQIRDTADLDSVVIPEGNILWSCDPAAANLLGLYRHLAAWLDKPDRKDLIVLRDRTDGTPEGNMAAAARLGSVLADGIGDLIHVESAASVQASLNLAYDILQASAVRRSKPEYVACPGCGRTLFDLQSTTQRIRAKTMHLKNISIAVMGCIVNGPGEMADADFGYVGGAPGKINLYVGKNCVRYNIPEAEADDRLVDLIREHGRWTEPDREDIATRSQGAVA